MSHLKEEVQSRKTFAIISPPGCWKTTIQNNYLYGAIRQAGTVKGKKTGSLQNLTDGNRNNVDFCYEFGNASGIRWNHINIVDTPGREDFSEDTYRTLMAVDKVVMVIDSAKGIEPQTKKLFEVCSMRGI